MIPRKPREVGEGKLGNLGLAFKEYSSWSFDKLVPKNEPAGTVGGLLARSEGDVLYRLIIDMIVILL
mgnify:FL=1